MMRRVAFAWHRLPDHGARLIRAVVDRSDLPVSVVATKPSVPIEGMEESLGQHIHWLEPSGKMAPRLDWHKLDEEVPDILFVGGYRTPAFNALARQVRRSGGAVVLMTDNNWQASITQRFIEPIRHRILYRHRFDGVFVPGRSGVRNATNWGYHVSQIAEGLYGSDPLLFNKGRPILERPKEFLFVGQFIERKNVLGLADAFVAFAKEHQDWGLTLCGSGKQLSDIPSHPRINVQGFVQPKQLSDLMGRSRCLVLPSLEEHWGIVVHEAALSGCALALSETVGAAEDLARPENAVTFTPGDHISLVGALSEIATWEKSQWQKANEISRSTASRFGPEVFADAVDRFTANTPS